MGSEPLREVTVCDMVQCCPQMQVKAVPSKEEAREFLPSSLSPSSCCAKRNQNFDYIKRFPILPQSILNEPYPRETAAFLTDLFPHKAILPQDKVRALATRTVQWSF